MGVFIDINDTMFAFTTERGNPNKKSGFNLISIYFYNIYTPAIVLSDAVQLTAVTTQVTCDPPAEAGQGGSSQFLSTCETKKCGEKVKTSSLLCASFFLSIRRW